MKLNELKARAQRFLTGAFRSEDLSHLFLFLRNHSFGNETVRDIGNMLGHADARDQGLSLSRVTHIYRMLRFTTNKLHRGHIDLEDAPAEMIDAMESAALLMRDTTLAVHGYSRAQATTAISKIRRKFRKKDNGRLAWDANFITDKEMNVIRTFSSWLIVEPAYTADDLYNETSFLLQRHGLMAAEEARLLLEKRPLLILFAACSMHGVRYKMPNGAFATARAGWSSDNDDGPMVAVTAAAECEYGDRQVTVSFPILETGLRAADWVEEFDATIRDTTLPHPIEISSNLKIASIGH